MSTPTGGNPHSSGKTPQLTEAEQRATLATVTRRLVPLLFLCYIIAYIDRINVGFAKLHLREVLGVSAGDAGPPPSGGDGSRDFFHWLFYF